jgi:hypothetical protein
MTHKPRTTRVPQTQGRSPTGRARIVPAPRSSNTGLIIGGAVGGLVLLIVVIAAASSGPKPKPVEKKKEAPPPAVVEQPKEKPPETGQIMFFCTGSDKHDDREQSITKCAKCGARARFLFDYSVNKFKCLPCGTLTGEAEIKCPDCGRPPSRGARIKPRPD